MCNTCMCVQYILGYNYVLQFLSLSAIWPPTARPHYILPLYFSFFLFCQHRWKTSHGISIKHGQQVESDVDLQMPAENFGCFPAYFGAQKNHIFWQLFCDYHTRHHISPEWNMLFFSIILLCFFAWLMLPMKSSLIYLYSVFLADL